MLAEHFRPARLLSELVLFERSCLTHEECLPGRLMHASSFIAAVGALCSGSDGPTDGLQNLIADRLRRAGRGLGEFRTLL